MWNDNEETRRGNNWRQWKIGWRYKKDAPKDRQWIKDRDKLFNINGNGWRRFYIKRKEDK